MFAVQEKPPASKPVHQTAIHRTGLVLPLRVRSEKHTTRFQPQDGLSSANLDISRRQTKKPFRNTVELRLGVSILHHPPSPHAAAAHRLLGRYTHSDRYAGEDPSTSPYPIHTSSPLLPTQTPHAIMHALSNPIPRLARKYPHRRYAARPLHTSTLNAGHLRYTCFAMPCMYAKIPTTRRGSPLTAF